MNELKERIAKALFKEYYPVGVGIYARTWEEVGKTDCYPNIKVEYYKKADIILASSSQQPGSGS